MKQLFFAYSNATRATSKGVETNTPVLRINNFVIPERVHLVKKCLTVPIAHGDLFVFDLRKAIGSFYSHFSRGTKEEHSPNHSNHKGQSQCESVFSRIEVLRLRVDSKI